LPQNGLRKRERTGDATYATVWNRLTSVVLQRQLIQAHLQLCGPLIVVRLDRYKAVKATSGLRPVSLLLMQPPELLQGANMRRIDLL
jgi:hypothetical protein